MDKKHTTLTFKTKVKPTKKINDEFTLCKCYAFGLGKNRNYSYVSKENMERNKDTLSYAPVVGHLIDKYDADGNKIGRYMGGHDMEITDDWEFKSVCVPYGVVVADSFAYETVKEYGDEKERDYLTCDVVLWTGRYPELNEALYSDDIYFNESAELGVETYRPYEKDSNYTDLVDFTFSALCLLGKADDKASVEHTEPCFIESKVVPKEFSLNSDEFAKVMGEMKQELAFYFNKETDGKEDNVVEEEIKDAVTEEVIDTPIDENQDEVPVATPVVEENAVENPEISEEMSNEELGTETNFEEEVVEEETPVEDTVVEESTDDDVTVDEELPVVENALDADTDEVDAFEILQKEFDIYKSEHSYSNDEYMALKQFKEDIEYKELHAQKEEILSAQEYAILADENDFKDLVSKIDEYSIEDLQNKADILFAKHVKATKSFSLEEKPEQNVKTTSMSFGVSFDNADNEDPYGGLFKEFNN